MCYCESMMRLASLVLLCGCLVWTGGCEIKQRLVRPPVHQGCGDGVCSSEEHPGICPVDCPLDLCGNPVPEVDKIRAEIAAKLALKPEQIIWSTSQTHSSPTLPGSNTPGGSSITVRGEFDEAFCLQERRTFMDRCVSTDIRGSMKRDESPSGLDLVTKGHITRGSQRR